MKNLLFPLLLLLAPAARGPLLAQELTFASTALLPGAGLNDVAALAADGAGNLFLGGNFRGDFRYAGPDGPRLEPASDSRIAQPYLIKRRPDGTTAWARVLPEALEGDCRGRCSGEFIRLLAAPDGSVYAVAALETTFDLDPGPGQRIDSALTILQRYSADGELLSTYTLRGRDYNSGDERIQGLATDAAGNLYLSGIFSRQMTFSTGADSVSFDQQLGEASFFNGFLMRIGPDGAIAWTNLLRLNLLSMPANNIAIINNRTLHLITRARNGVDFDPGPGQARTEGGGQAPTALARYDLAGALVGLRSLPGQEGFGGTGPGAWDAAGNVYSIGFVSGETANLAPTDAPPVLVPGPGTYLASHTAAGGLRWAVPLPNVTSLRDVVVDRGGNAVITGTIGPAGGSLPVGDDPAGFTVAAAPNRETAFVQQYSPAGVGRAPTVVTSTRAPRTNNFVVPTALAGGPRGEVYVGGVYRGDLVFPGGVTEMGALGTQVFLLEFGGLLSGASGPRGFAAPPVVFPNPVAGGPLTVRLDRPYAEVRLTLLDARGRRLREVVVRNNDRGRLFPPAGLPAGAYFLRVVAGGQRAALLPVWVSASAQ